MVVLGLSFASASVLLCDGRSKVFVCITFQYSQLKLAKFYSLLLRYFEVAVLLYSVIAAPERSKMFFSPQ